MIKTYSKIQKYGLVYSFKVLIGTVLLPLRRIVRALKLYKVRLTSQNFCINKEVQGSKMLLNLGDSGISQELYFCGVHEASSTKQFKQEIKPGMTIVEVGANVGYYALIEARIIGKEGRIIAFEPSPANMQSLKANVVLNDFNDRIETHQLGIGSEVGKMKFYLMNRGNMSSFYNRQEGGGIKTLDYIEVETTTLDTFFKDKNIKIDYLRMDVEGFEFEVINGMKEILNSDNAPDGFFIEIHSSLLNENGRSCKEFLDLLEAYDLRISSARYRGKANMLVKSNEELKKHKLCEDGYWEAFFRSKNAN